MANVTTRKGQVVENPKVVDWLLNDPRAGWIWFVLRIWVGWQWISASLHKIGNPAWVAGGTALKGYWTNAVAVPTDGGHAAVAYGWYRAFLQMMLNAQAYTWFAKLVAYGEFLVGIALVLGLFTGIAAFFGGLMNWSYMMAGSASTNPMLFLIAVGLILAWKVAGYIGVDYFLLPALGTPWQLRKPNPVGAGAQASKPVSGD